MGRHREGLRQKLRTHDEIAVLQSAPQSTSLKVYYLGVAALE
jgi:hypothetical protein